MVDNLNLSMLKWSFFYFYVLSITGPLIDQFIHFLHISFNTLYFIGEHGCKTRNIFNKQLDTLCVLETLWLRVSTLLPTICIVDINTKFEKQDELMANI